MFKKVILLSLVCITVVLVTGTWCISFIRVTKPIPFDSLSIEPDGTPRLGPFEIKVGGKSRNESLELAHRLVFDGDKYFSELYLPIIASYLIQRDKDLYEWRDLRGWTFLLKSQPDDIKEGWHITPIDGEQLLVSDSRSEEHYTYSNGLLQEAYHNGVRQRYYYEGKRLQRIEEGQPGNQSSLEFFYDRDGRLSAINSPDGHLRFWRSDDGLLAGIKRDNALVMTFIYSDGLLAGAYCDGKAFNWTWGTTRMVHSRPHIPLSPMLRSDGANNYEIVYDGNLVKVCWTQIKSGITKKWDYLPLTGRMIVRPF